MGDEELVERLARAIHEHYLAAESRKGVKAGDTSAMAPWTVLGAYLREENRAQARDIEVKLARIGCSISSGGEDMSGFAFTAPEVEELSRDEHGRWTRHRETAGWSYGPVRDDQARRHPGIVRWDLLSEAERQKDRNVVRTIPALLAVVGLRPRRTSG